MPYIKIQLQNFVQLKSNVTVETKISEGDIIEHSSDTITTLEETQTRADMTLNKNRLSGKEETIEIKLELNNTNEKSDLYINPKFSIELPEFITDAKINSVNILFDQELNLKKYEAITNQEGRKVLQVELTGTQTKFNTIPNINGTTVVISARLESRETSEGIVKLQTTNENAVGYSTSAKQEADLSVIVKNIVMTVLGVGSEENLDLTSKEETAKGNLSLEIYSNENLTVVKEGENFIYNIVLNHSAESNLWSEEDENRGQEITAMINELAKLDEDGTITQDEAIKLIELEEELDALYKKYARGELKEYYELLELVDKGLNVLIEEYHSINESVEEDEELTEEQKTRLNELEEKINNIDIDNITEEQKSRYKELEKKAQSGTLNTFTEIKDVTITLDIPRELKYESARIIDSEVGKFTYDETTKTLKLEIEEFSQYETTLWLEIKTTVNTLEDTYYKELENSVELSYKQDGKRVTTEIVAKAIVGKEGLEIVKTSEGIEDINRPGDLIKFKVQMKNIGAIDFYGFDSIVTLPEGLSLEEVNYGTLANEETGAIENIVTDRSKVLSQIEIPIDYLKAGDTYVAYVSARVETLPEDYTNKYKTMTVEADIKGKKVTWDIKVENTNEGSIIDPDNPDGTSKYTLSGLAWVDKNNSGIKEENEELKANVKVTLINVTQSIAIDTAMTNAYGAYEFSNVEPGDYQVLFEYDGTKYLLADYKKTDEDEVNSKAIEVTMGIAITDTITLTNRSIQNINIGLVKIPDFYISIDKSIRKVIVQNSSGTKTYDFNNTDLAKIEINSKYINSTTVLVEYSIRVKNEGELAGIVQKIVDYIPSGMVFSSDLNPTWIQGSDGNLYSTELSNIVIEPGETKEVILVLRKKMTEDNTGIVNNRAEITDITNSMNLPNVNPNKDASSNSNNIQEGISSADIIIGVATGQEVIFIIIAIVCMVTLGVGIHFINRKVVIKD